MHKIISTFAVLLLVATATWAQTGRVVGVVTFANGDPGANALVSLEGNGGPHHHHYEMVADDNGAFDFDSVAAGHYEIAAMMAGHGIAEDQIEVIAETTRINLIIAGNPEQTGSVTGQVLDPISHPVPLAVVRLDGQSGPHGGHHYMAMTNPNGAFHFNSVETGPYQITAMLPMRGFAGAQIEVLANQTTNVTLILDDSLNHGGHGEHYGDTLTLVDLAGTAIVLAPDSTHRAVRFFLDIDNDGTADYRLAFGPPWYHPDSSNAHRPQNGDQITVHGGLLTYSDPPIVVVYEINGMYWRRPFRGHGGNGGGDHGYNGCNPDSVVRVELTGTSILDRCMGFHGDFSYKMDVDSDDVADFHLDFGAPDYNPGNGADRPGDHEPLFIVGGLVYCHHERVCGLDLDRPNIVIVYEINGQFWREPGDTLGLGPSPIILSADEPTYLGAPASYLVAKNFPNPFNPVTTIAYSVPISGNVKLAVFDITGREVTTLVNSRLEAGSYSVAWDGSRFASGIYFYRVTVGSLSFTNRMVMIK